MPRQERDLFGHDAQPGTSSPPLLRNFPLGVPLPDLLSCPASVQVNLLPGGIIENQHSALWKIPNQNSNFRPLTGPDPASSLKRCIRHSTNIPGYNSLCQYHPGKIWGRGSGYFPTAQTVP